MTSLRSPRAPRRADRASIEVLVAGIAAREPRALGRAISLVERGGPEAEALVARLRERTGRARVVGLTGPPGAGKSTLVEALARRARQAGRTVAVLAVDPTSPFTGGALLGDRIRMQSLYTDPGVFIRSMATRGAVGGLAAAAHDAVDLLDAAGFDLVLVETVGVGQDEIDVVRAVDTVAVVVVPGMGDDVQAAKAGLLEIADVFVLNKADQDGADRALRNLGAMVALSHEPGETRAGAPAAGWTVPVVATVASRDEGVAELAAALEEHRRHLEASGELARRRLARLALREARTARRGARAGGRTVDHVGIAVRSIAEARRFWEALGLPVAAIEEVPHEGVRVAIIPCGESRIELLEPTREGSPVATFLDRRGEGIHHLCLGTGDVAADDAALRAAGYQVLRPQPIAGAGGSRVQFVHPKSAHGVLVELAEPADAGLELDVLDEEA
jgi:LAO/AO transport system kinase